MCFTNFQGIFQSKARFFFLGLGRSTKTTLLNSFLHNTRGKKRVYIYIYPGSPGRLLIQWSFRKDHCFTRDLHQQFQGTIILMVFDLQGIYIYTYMLYIYIYYIQISSKMFQKNVPSFFQTSESHLVWPLFAQTAALANSVEGVLPTPSGNDTWLTLMLPAGCISWIREPPGCQWEMKVG